MKIINSTGEVEQMGGHRVEFLYSMPTNTMNNTENTQTWADLIGNPTYDESLDWDDTYSREAIDYRRAQRDGWGSQLVWDGR